MKTIITKDIQITKYSKPIKGYKSVAKTQIGAIIGLIQKFRNDTKKGKTYTPLELSEVFSEVLRKIHTLEKV